MTDAAVRDDLAPVADLVVARAAGREGASLVVGLAGGVSVGKSTLAGAVAAVLAEHHDLDTLVVSSDGFLQPTAVLAEKGLLARKGFPESYDHEAIVAFIASIRAGDDELLVPVYDHLFYDVLPERRVVERTPVVIVEGVNVLHYADHLDLTLYVDADEPDMRRWYVRRVLALRDEAASVPGAYLHPFRDASDADVTAMALGVWEAINLPNLRESIEPTRAHADVVVVKGPDHEVVEVVEAGRR